MTDEQLKTIAAQLRQPSGEAGIATGKRMNEGNRLINIRTIEQLTIRPGDVVLEIGMGNGYFVPHLFSIEPGINYIGCDFSETMVNESVQMNQNLVSAGKAKFIHCAADQLPFNDSSANAIFTVNTIYFWSDPGVVLEEFKRVLSTSGTLVIGIRPRSAMAAYPFAKFGFRMYEKEELIDLLKKAGFAVQSVIQRAEPDQDLGGVKIKVASLIVTAIKK